MDGDDIRAKLERVWQVQADEDQAVKGKPIETRLSFAVGLLTQILEEMVKEVELLQAERELREAEKRRRP